MPSGIWLYSYLALWALLLAESLLLIALIRQVTHLHHHWVLQDPTAGLPLGALAPVLSGADIDGHSVSLGESRGRKTVIYFLSPGCSSCGKVLEHVPTLSDIGDFDTVLVVGANELKARLLIAPYFPETGSPPAPVLADPNGEFSKRSRVGAVPYVVIVDEDGRIGGKGVGSSALDTGVLVTQAEELRRKRLGWTEEDGLPASPDETASTSADARVA